MNQLVSVIIPCFKVEKTIERCLASVFNQSYQPIEIICVNDASPDQTISILKQYQDKIIIVDKKVNEGLGMARNSGLEVATGRYVFFLDSDDEIKKDTIASLVATIKDSDLCIGSFVRSSKAGDTNIHPIINETMAINDCLYKMTGPNAAMADMEYHMAAKNLYDMELISKYHLRFESEREILAEDFIFTLDYFRYVHQLRCCDYDGYIYYDNEGTLTTAYRKNRFELLNQLNQAVLSRIDGKMPLDRFKRNYLVVAQRCMSQEVRFNPYKKALYHIGQILMHPTLKQYALELKNDDSIKSKIMNRLILGGHRHMIYMIFKLYNLKKGHQ